MKASVQALALWGKQAPAHSITAILITEDQRTVVTGSQEGPLCLWNLSPELKISSKQILLGHTAPVTCLAKARDFEKQPYVVSATENGEMCIWNVTSGQCIEHTQLPFRHTAICYYHSSFRMTGDGWLLCCGQYNDILLVDARTLTVLHTLTSSQSSNWVSCMCLVHSPRIQEDSLIAVSASGDLKVWDLSSSVTRIQEKQLVAERESKSLDGTSCQAIRFCPYTERLLLAVFSSCWKVYDYCDFSLLWTESSPSSHSWAGGEVLAAHQLVVWTEAGQGYIYQLLNSCLSRSKQPPDRRALTETVCPLLLCSTAVRDNESFSYVMGFMNERKEPFYKILYSGDASGRITLWHIPDVPVSTLDGSPKEIPIAASWTLQDHFDAHGSVAEGILDPLCGAGQGGRRGPGSSVYIPSLDKLVCGCEDGRIFIVPALQAVKTRLLEEVSVLKDPLPHRILAGHSSSVTSLLYLRGWSARFDPSWLVSGSQDSCVIWWDMFTGEILHQFSLQAGPVTQLLLSSENYRFQGQRIVCCLCSDHSVALLHLQARACILHARKHLSPVRVLRWHPLENLLVVGCENDSVSVWDIETGILERQETGEAAKAVLAGCEDSPLSTADSLLLPTFGDDTHRQKDTGGGGPPSSSCIVGPLSHGGGPPPREKPSHRLSSVCRAQWPFTILPIKTKWENRNFHILLFDLESLTELLRSSQLNGLKSSNSLHSCDALERVKSTAEKGTLLLRRNKTTGALSPPDGPGEEQDFGDVPAAGCLEQGGGLKRQKKAKSSKKRRHQPSGRVSISVATDTAKLLLACLLPWGVDRETDILCVQHLGIPRLLWPVSFGLVSKEHCLSLMLPGWSHTNSPPWDQHSQSVSVFSSKVLDLRNKYLSAAQEPPGKPNGRTKNSGPPEGPPTLVSLLNRICLVKRIISMPLDKSSTQKVESVRTKWRATPSAGTTGCHEESSEGTFGFPARDAENISLVKLISCWRDQSIEVVEAMQAVLLAEVQRSTKNLQTTLANGHGPGPASLAKASKEEPNPELPEGPKSCPLLAATPGVQHDSSLSPEISPGGEETSDDQNILEGTDNRGEKKPHPWMSKVCSCKMC
ncbi:PREDICTED: WD repeat-containing protein 72 [Gekko japonicus]|uniref:WD repeat-containing protein 72 n=1 Tax=Gekko japonicus TaxID=146911 RepID=A0ABM1KNE0_GEKJA|nr:PREDICTED: WD repeat-containing protein 72 [Gekko japonicus]